MDTTSKERWQTLHNKFSRNFPFAGVQSPSPQFPKNNWITFWIWAKFPKHFGTECAKFGSGSKYFVNVSSYKYNLTVSNETQVHVKIHKKAWCYYIMH